MPRGGTPRDENALDSPFLRGQRPLGLWGMSLWLLGRPNLNGHPPVGPSGRPPP